MEEEKKYRVIIYTQDQLNIFSKYYPKALKQVYNHSLYKKPYYLSWTSGGHCALKFETLGPSFPEIKPIEFDEWYAEVVGNVKYTRELTYNLF